MGADASSFTDKWSEFLSSVWTQVRAALVVGLSEGEELRSGFGYETGDGGQLTRSRIRSMDDYPGYHTGKGLGSLDVGGGSSRWGE